LKAAGCTEIFQEKISGAKTDRKQLAKLISHLGQDDSLVVTRLDRRARSTNYLLNALGGFAEFERELIRSRTTEGRARAKAKGVVIGRKPKLTHHQRLEAISAGCRRAFGGYWYDVSHSTISRL
jgi:DNA invertase Pin-like site-specific DNA recombinase